MVSAQSQSSSVSATKPSSRGRTAPTLLTRMSMPPSSVAAAATSSPGPSAVVRSTETERTSAARGELVELGAPRERPGDDRDAFVGQRSGDGQADALAGAGDDRGPAPPGGGPSRHSPWSVEPGQARVGDLAPAVVDGQRVGAVGELEDVGGGLAVAVLLERRLGDRLGDGVVLAAHDQQQRPAALVVGGDLGRRVRVEVRGRGLEQRLARSRDRPASRTARPTPPRGWRCRRRSGTARRSARPRDACWRGS